MRKLILTILVALVLAASVQAQTLQPLQGADAPPLTEVVKVLMETDAGNLEIEVYPQAAPNAARRFVELVEMGFYDGTPIFRVVSKPSPFVAQFGINSDHKEWKENTFGDDPSLYQMTRGTLAFAKAGPDTNSTQVFINYRENNRLTAPELNFSAFARVTSGMEIADRFVSVGDERMGLDQDELWENHRMVEGMTLRPTMIKSMKVIEQEQGDR